jgi:hypothetical protein
MVPLFFHLTAPFGLGLRDHYGVDTSNYDGPFWKYINDLASDKHQLSHLKAEKGQCARDICPNLLILVGLIVQAAATSNSETLGNQDPGPRTQ